MVKLKSRSVLWHEEFHVANDPGQILDLNMKHSALGRSKDVEVRRKEGRGQ
jgi:hypothetical protein